MQLNTLVCKERPAEYEDFGSGVLEARNIGVLLVKILFVDCLPGLLMNLLSLSQITKQTSCKLNYKEAQIEFVLRATGEHKLMFTLLSNFYLCDLVTSVFRSNEAKVKDAVKLFTLSYLASAVWMPVVILDLADLDLAVFGPGYFGPGCFGIHVMYLNYHNDLLKIENGSTRMFSNKPFKSVKIMMATMIETLCLQ
jgi:hypothetical protein